MNVGGVFMSNETAMKDIIKDFKRYSTESITMDLVKEVKGVFMPLPKYVADLIDELRKLHLKDEVISVLLYQAVFMTNHQFETKNTADNKAFILYTLNMAKGWIRQYGKVETAEDAIWIAEKGAQNTTISTDKGNEPFQQEQKVTLQVKLQPHIYSMLKEITMASGHQSYEEPIAYAISRLYGELQKKR